MCGSSNLQCLSRISSAREKHQCHPRVGVSGSGEPLQFWTARLRGLKFHLRNGTARNNIDATVGAATCHAGVGVAPEFHPTRSILFRDLPIRNMYRFWRHGQIIAQRDVILIVYNES